MSSERMVLHGRRTGTTPVQTKQTLGEAPPTPPPRARAPADTLVAQRSHARARA